MTHKVFGDKLKTVRQELKLSQQDFASILKTNQSSISKMEREDMEVSIVFADEMFNRYYVNPEWFFDLKPNVPIFLDQSEADDTEGYSEEQEVIGKLKEQIQSLEKQLKDQDQVIMKMSKQIKRLEG